jgi:hypothetical protein
MTSDQSINLEQPITTEDTESPPEAKCNLCGKVELLDTAIDLGWQPSYWTTDASGTDVEITLPVCLGCCTSKLVWDAESETYGTPDTTRIKIQSEARAKAEADRITFHTSAPSNYDGFSTRTLRVVGRCTRSGNPVREVSCERRDYDWQTGRYSSGLCRFTMEQTPLEMYVRFGDWVLD